MHLVLIALGVGPGDEVIVPSFTWISSVNVIVHCGATPVFVDSLYNTGCLDPDAIEELVSERTKAIIAVHLYGEVAGMNSIKSCAEKFKIPIIEDCAEAIGATYDNNICLLYTSPSPRDQRGSRMPSSA